MSARPLVAVVVPVHNALARTIRFLESFARVEYSNYQVIVVDGGSTDGTADVLRSRFGAVRVLQGGNDLWWAGATNLGVAHALDNRFDFVLTINNDALVDPALLSRLVESAVDRPGRIVGSRIQFLEHPRTVWAVGARMHWRSGRIFELCGWGKDETDVLTQGRLIPAEILTGCGTLVPCTCYRDVGLYDARWFPQYHADAELILRAQRAGYGPFVDLHAVVFNDVEHTCAARVEGWRETVFSRRSAGYWRPIAAVHWRYCPWWLWPASVSQFYIRCVATRSRSARNVYQSVRRALSRAA